MYKKNEYKLSKLIHIVFEINLIIKSSFILIIIITNVIKNVYTLTYLVIVIV